MKYPITLVSLLLIAFGIIITEILAADDYDPAVEARKERKARVTKNEKQKEKNLNVAAASSQRDREETKAKLSKTLAVSRVSTASMGR